MESQNSVDNRRTAEIGPDQNLSMGHTGILVHAFLPPSCFKHTDKEDATEGDVSKLGIPECSSETMVSTSNEQQLHQEQESNVFLRHSLVEADTIEEIRKRNFSHWSRQSSPSTTQMIDAGFFCCNVGDRVICIYCNVICQQWTGNSDDPCEVHKTLSPKCPYVLAMPTAATSSSIRDNSSLSADAISNTALNPHYSGMSERLKTFTTWPNEDLPAVDDLVKAGFFYIGTKAIVTCFYCKGSLQNWAANDNPMIEHARWFPHCAYARQLCGTDLYRKIQESKRAQQERTGGGNSSHGRLMITDESMLSRYVAARLDLPISQNLLDRKVKLSVIKRCWEDQLRLKGDDFVNDLDLLIACTILQKQIDIIDGKKENITVPSVAMKRIREQHQADSHLHSDPETPARESTMLVSSSIISRTTQGPLSASSELHSEMEARPSSPAYLCVLCLTTERRLALLQCIHDFNNSFDVIHDEFGFRENPCPYTERTMMNSLIVHVS